MAMPFGFHHAFSGKLENSVSYRLEEQQPFSVDAASL